jgi:phospholipid/cholesterol/gamma-HCH transport system substrate-binding protein
MSDKEKQPNTIVAMFVLLGLAIMGGLIVAFGGGRTLFISTYDLQVVFPKGVQSVQQGQTVTLYGKRIGETKDVKFVDDNALEKGVIVVVKVESVDLPAWLEMIVTPNLMGLGKAPVELFVRDPADKTKLPRDGTARIPGRMLPMLDQLIPKDMQTTLTTATKHIGELADRLKPVAENINRMMEARKLVDVDAKTATANFDSVMQRFDASLKAFTAVVGSPDNQQNFAAVLANSRKISETGVQTMENVCDITAEGKQVTRNAGELLRKLAAASDDLSSMLKHMDELVAAMNQKTGTVGLLLNDNRLYEELLLSARRLTKTLDDMREVLDLAKKGQLRIKAF